MDIQHALLSKIVQGGELTLAVNARITTDFFSDEHYRRIYEYMLKHWGDYGVAPDEGVLHTAFPNFGLLEYAQPIEYFIDQLRNRRKKFILTETLNQAALHLKSDDPNSVDDMEVTIQDGLRQARLETSTSYDVDFTTMGPEILRRLDERQSDPGYLRGISTGFDGIDYVTGGLQPEQYVVLLGLPKSFKSATLLAMAKACHAQAMVPLFIGFEMSNIEQEDRMLSLFSGVSLSKIMNGTFGVREHRDIKAALKMIEEMRPLMFSSDITSAMTVSGIQAKAQEYLPDVIFVDGAYMMQSELARVEPGSAQALTNISRSLKRMAQGQKIPVVVTTQASLNRSKGGLTLASGMYTQAWGQDCDILLGVERQGERREDESISTDPVQVKFKVIESRSGPRKSVILEWDWHHGHVEELDPKVMQERLSQQNTPTDDGTGEWDSDD